MTRRNRRTRRGKKPQIEAGAPEAEEVEEVEGGVEDVVVEEGFRQVGSIRLFGALGEVLGVISCYQYLVRYCS